jgi:hypothetical protein
MEGREIKEKELNRQWREREGKRGREGERRDIMRKEIEKVDKQMEIEGRERSREGGREKRRRRRRRRERERKKEER